MSIGLTDAAIAALRAQPKGEAVAVIIKKETPLRTGVFLHEAAEKLPFGRHPLYAHPAPAEGDKLREAVDAVKVLLYSDEVFVGSHWEGDFRDPATKVWPTFCAHFANYGSDAEEIPEAELIPLADLVREFGRDAISAWVCFRRGLDKPPKGNLGAKGKAALAVLKARGAA